VAFVLVMLSRHLGQEEQLLIDSFCVSIVHPPSRTRKSSGPTDQPSPGDQSGSDEQDFGEEECGRDLPPDQVMYGNGYSVICHLDAEWKRVGTRVGDDRTIE
jgi:hypothetical protein